MNPADLETLIATAWDIYDEDPEHHNADTLRASTWALEEAVDLGISNPQRLVRDVVEAMSMVTGDTTAELLAPMPSVTTIEVAP